MATAPNARRLNPGQLGAMMKAASAQVSAGGRGAGSGSSGAAQKQQAMQGMIGAHGLMGAVRAQHAAAEKQQALQNMTGAQGLQNAQRQRREDKATSNAANKFGRARRKKTGNYTTYGQTGGSSFDPGRTFGEGFAKHNHGGGKTRKGHPKLPPYLQGGDNGALLAPHDPKPGVTPGRVPVGNAHGIAIVRGPSGPAAAKNHAVTGFVKEQAMQRLKAAPNDGLYVDKRPHRKGRKRGRPQYTTGTGAINPKTGNRLYF